jgi:DNA-binding transcriptional LysR family regulator
LRTEPLQGSFIARRLARTDVLLCAAPAYLGHAGRPDQPAALASHPLLVLAAESRRPLTLLGDTGGSPRAVTLPAPAPALCSENPQVHLAAALGGLGIAALPSFMVHDELASGRLERVLPAWHVQGLTVWACLLSRRHLPASTRGLLDFLLQEFGGADADPWQA